MKVQIFLYSLLLLLGGCARSPLKDAAQAMRPASDPPALRDDLPLKGLVHGLVQTITTLNADIEGSLQFGPRKISKTEYAQALIKLLNFMRQMKSKDDFFTYINKNFEFYEVYGEREWGDVFITSYYEPVIRGSLKRTSVFSQPLYKTPEEMLVVDLKAYAEKFPRWKVILEDVLEQKSRKSIVRGRLIQSKNANGLRQVLPFYDRLEIDSNSVFKGRGLELAYVDPIDAFFLQIQGSGIVQLPNKRELRLGYDSQNGYPYVAIGRFLKEEIPLAEMTLQKIEDHLRRLPREKQQELFNQNPSYVFFRKLDSAAQTYLGTDVIPGRTVATDHGFFPKGGLAFLEFPKPVFASDNDDNPWLFENTGRFVLDHDTGGAIRGGGRLDLFWGRGDEAKRNAGVMKHRGRLFYLLPKMGG